MTRWPDPADTAVDRARTIANSLLEHLPADERPSWVARAHGLGETWLGEERLRWTDNDIVSTAEAAGLIHVGPSTIRKWHSEGRLRAHSRGRYVVRDVFDAAAAIRRRRAAKRSA
jgi:hypothetical protein